MNDPSGLRPAPVPVRPAPAGDTALPVLHVGRLQSDWCPACKAFTTVLADLLLLAPDGVTTVGTLRWCEICDDPDDPLPPRRIDRG